MSTITNFLALIPLLGLATACTGGEMDAEEGEVPAPIALLIPEEGACATFVDSQSAYDLFSSALASGEADVVGIAEARIVEECSGAGGTHVFSSATADGKRFWLGSHACWLEVPSANLDSGVIVGLGAQTAGLHEGVDDWCMSYPGETQVFATDVDTSAIAWFASQADAQRFLNAL